MGILEGKRGLIMGVANEKSAAWGLRPRPRQGAELAFTYQMEGFRKRLEPLAASVGSDFLIPCDVLKIPLQQIRLLLCAEDGTAWIFSFMQSAFQTKAS